MRRTSIVVTAVACFAFAVVAPAHAQAPTIVTDVTFSEEGVFGTFTATAPLCPSGTFVDEFVAGGGFQSGRVHAVTVRKTFTCADDSGTFTILFHPQRTTATPAGCDEAGAFAVVGGTGDYAKLRGHGDFCLLPPLANGHFSETFTGTFALR
jgi:hypothetical protein